MTTNNNPPSLSEFINQTKGIAYKKRILEWFRINLGKHVTSSQLAQIPGEDGNPISHNIRRVFELRDEDGFEIANWKDNDATGLNLRVDEWVLMKNDPNPKKIRSRGVNKRIMYDVFSRDSFRCKCCGRGPDSDDPFKPGHKIKLHVGHIIAHKQDGSLQVQPIENIQTDIQLTINDFITMCNVCNEGAKNKNLKMKTLLDVVKEADLETKKTILNYLKEELKT